MLYDVVKIGNHRQQTIVKHVAILTYCKRGHTCHKKVKEKHVPIHISTT